MSTSGLRLRYLFDRYYNKTATQQERDELFAIIAAGERDEEISGLIQSAWDDLHHNEPVFNTAQSETLLTNILSADPKPAGKTKNNRTFFLWAKITSAAVVLIVVGVGVKTILRKPKQIAPKTAMRIQPLKNDALPGGNRAILILGNQKAITLDNAQNGTLAKQGTTLINKTANGQLVYNAANVTDSDAPVSINTIATPRGGQYQVVLPDGTKVWLNAASSIRFPTRFTGNSRNVAITGEAYFEVTKNKAMPFRVKTNRAEIEVLGTHFNVMAYDDESLMKTTLLEGAVNIRSGNTSNLLKPGEQAQVTAAGKTLVTNDIDIDDEVAWKNGLFQFKEVGVDVILRQASRWYDLDISYAGKVPDKKLTGRLSRNVKASGLLDILRYLGVDIKIEGQKLIVN